MPDAGAEGASLGSGVEGTAVGSGAVLGSGAGASEGSGATDGSALGTGASVDSGAVGADDADGSTIGSSAKVAVGPRMYVTKTTSWSSTSSRATRSAVGTQRQHEDLFPSTSDSGHRYPGDE